MTLPTGARPRLLLVPPDVRPPTLELPRHLAAAVGFEVQVPPPEALPRENRPGDTARLAAWLDRHAPGAAAVIACLETLALGGMIPARRERTPSEVALARLEPLVRLAARPGAPRVYAHGVITRVAHDDDPLEEKPYYGRWGAALRTYSEAADRAELDEGAATAAALDAARAALPSEVLDDWLATRARNHALHRRALELLEAGVLAHLCLTLDDTRPLGLAARDRRDLVRRIDAAGLWHAADVYPGADEVPAALVARAARDLAGAPPPRVWVRTSARLGAGAETLYEDRPLGELVRAHLRAAGCVPADSPAEAAFVLAVNTPAVRQGQASRQPAPEVDGAARNLPAFVDAVADDLAADRRVVVADVAYANGAELRFVRLLEDGLVRRGFRFSDLAGFAAWNTAGNSLGSAVAMGALAGRVRDRAAWTAGCYARLVDDWLYQSVVRPAVAAELASAGDPPDPFDLGARRADAEARVADRMETPALELWERHFAAPGLHLRWERPRLAWPRLFTGVFPFEVDAGPGSDPDPDTDPTEDAASGAAPEPFPDR